MKTVIAIDLGTTGNRVIAFSKKGGILAQSYAEFPQIFPKPGWVEHDPWTIWKTLLRTLKAVVGQVGVRNIDCLGLTNQRETTILWNKKTGKPVYNAIVWQDRRTKDFCEDNNNTSGIIRKKTGLFLDPYFSATKIKWILDHIKGVRREVERGEVVFGTVDSWILWQLTGGKVHATEVSNASRTLCFNIHTLDYDEELLRIFGLPRRIFPEVKDSAGLFGTLSRGLVGKEIPIMGILGDQQASLFAHGGWQPGVVKNTYGTGLFLMTTTGKNVPHSGKLINTISWKINGQVSYAVEGSVFIGGSCIQWLRDGLGMIQSAKDTEKMATSLKSNEGVYFVPALAGLGAPYWDPSARGLLIGLTRGTTSQHIARAALESLAYQTRDVVEEMRKVIPHHSFKKLRVDGGAVGNNFLMQFQADILNLRVERPYLTETTALGAAGIAGISSGFWSQDEFSKAGKIEKIFHPKMKAQKREFYYGLWKNAVRRAMHWE